MHLEELEPEHTLLSFRRVKKRDKVKLGQENRKLGNLNTCIILSKFLLLNFSLPGALVGPFSSISHKNLSRPLKYKNSCS